MMDSHGAQRAHQPDQHSPIIFWRADRPPGGGRLPAAARPGHPGQPDLGQHPAGRARLYGHGGHPDRRARRVRRHPLSRADPPVPRHLLLLLRPDDRAAGGDPLVAAPADAGGGRPAGRDHRVALRPGGEGLGDPRGDGGGGAAGRADPAPGDRDQGRRRGDRPGLGRLGRRVRAVAVPGRDAGRHPGGRVPEGRPGKVPTPEVTLGAGDLLLVMGTPEAIERLREYYVSPRAGDRPRSGRPRG